MLYITYVQINKMDSILELYKGIKKRLCIALYKQGNFLTYDLFDLLILISGNILSFFEINVFLIRQLFYQ